MGALGKDPWARRECKDKDGRVVCQTKTVSMECSSPIKRVFWLQWARKC